MTSRVLQTRQVIIDPQETSRWVLSLAQGHVTQSGGFLPEDWTSIQRVLAQSAAEHWASTGQWNGKTSVALLNCWSVRAAADVKLCSL